MAIKAALVNETTGKVENVVVVQSLEEPVRKGYRLVDMSGEQGEAGDTWTEGGGLVRDAVKEAIEQDETKARYYTDVWEWE